jgi:long-chain acyl-CoA synthetase
MSVLITGATGFLGSYVAARIMDQGEEVVCLVRGKDAQQRLDSAVGPGAHALTGDLTSQVPTLPDHVTRVLHCAANVSFTEELSAARAINVEGTRRLLAAAQRLPHLERLVHVSTAYVAGTTDGAFNETDGDIGQAFRNTYEQSKLEAEQVVVASGLPATIVRPSIVVGDSRTGWTRSFNVLYPPLRAFARGLVTEVPADPAGIVDIVPVDHVADVIEAAMQEDFPVLHAVAAERAVTTSDVARLAAAAFDRPPPIFTEQVEAASAALEIYFPYFSVRSRFKAGGARGLALSPPPLAAYFDTLIAFAEEARWGRSPQPLSRATTV